MCRMQISGLSDSVSEDFRGGFVKDFRIYSNFFLRSIFIHDIYTGFILHLHIFIGI